MIFQYLCVIFATLELSVHSSAPSDCDQLGDDAEGGDCSSMLAQRMLLSHRHLSSPASADSDYITDKVCVKNKVAGDLSFKVYTEDGKKVGSHDDFETGQEKCTAVASTEGTELKLKTAAYWGTSKTWNPHFTYSSSSDACTLVWKCSGTVDSYDCDITSGCKSTTTTTTTSTSSTTSVCSNPWISDFEYYNVLWEPDGTNLEIWTLCDNVNGSQDLTCSNTLGATYTQTETLQVTATVGGSIQGSVTFKEGFAVESVAFGVQLTLQGSFTEGVTKTETQTISMNSECAIEAEAPGQCDKIVAFLTVGTMTFDWNATLNCDDGTTQQGSGTVVGGSVASTASVSGCAEEDLTTEECEAYVKETADPASLVSLSKSLAGRNDGYKEVCVYNGVSADIKFKIYNHDDDDSGAGGYNSWYPAAQTKCAYATGTTGDQMKVKIYADDLTGGNPVSKQWFTYDVDGGTINFKCSGTEWDISCSEG